MFLWWLQNKSESPRSKVRDQPHKSLRFNESASSSEEPQPSNPLEWLNVFWGQLGATDEALFEAEQQEIDELETVLSQASLYRKSHVSKGKYIVYQDIEGRTLLGDHMRRECEQRRRQRSQFAEAHKQAGYERAQRSRAQRDAALERVRCHREENASRGSRVKDEKDEWLVEIGRQRDKWRLHGAVHAGREGRLEHQRRLQESKDELLAERRAAAIEAKRLREERMQAEREAAVAIIEHNRQRVDRVREQTKSEVAMASADASYRSRLATADVVRDAVVGWKSERSHTQNVFVAKARQRHAEFRQASILVDPVAELAYTRTQNADAMRLSLAHLEARDKMQRLNHEVSRWHSARRLPRRTLPVSLSAYTPLLRAAYARSRPHLVRIPRRAHTHGGVRIALRVPQVTKRELHDEAYEGKFVDTNLAATVEIHPHHALANAHRDTRRASSTAVGRWITGEDSNHTPAGSLPLAVPTLKVGAAQEGDAFEADAQPGAAYEGVAREPSRSALVGKPKWKPTIKSSGWFSMR